VSEIDDLFARTDAHCDRLDAMRREILDYLDRRLPDVPLHERGFGMMDEPLAMIGPSPAWESQMQRTGRAEMALRLRAEGPAAAADYAARFEQSNNQWLAWNGYAPGFVFKPIPLPAVT
jgi:hypothetical protein